MVIYLQSLREFLIWGEAFPDIGYRISRQLDCNGICISLYRIPTYNHFTVHASARPRNLLEKFIFSRMVLKKLATQAYVVDNFSKSQIGNGDKNQEAEREDIFSFGILSQRKLFATRIHVPQSDPKIVIQNCYLHTFFRNYKIVMVTQIKYISRNQLHSAGNFYFGLMGKKKHCWALPTNFLVQFS